MSLRQNDGYVDPMAIIAAYEERRWERGGLINEMHELLRTYNGEVAVPLHELNASEHSLVGNLVVQGVDAMAQRINSIQPTPEYASIRPGIRIRDEDADKRKSVNLSWWDKNSMRSKLARRARHYTGHGLTATVIRPNSEWEAPMWHLRSPLEAYPAELVNDDDVAPCDVIFCYRRKYGWLKTNHPLVAMDFYVRERTTSKTEIEILEYVDAWGTVLIARNIAEPTWGGNTTRKVRILENVEYDYGGIIPATVLGRVTLGGKIQGQFNQMVPMYRMQAKIAALEVAAIQKGIFSKVWFVSGNGQEPTIVQWPDPYNDKPGLVTDAQMQQEVMSTPYQAGQMRSDLEYAQRMTARIPSEQGGQGATNVRTGMRGAQILSQTVDFPVQEAQDDLCRALEHENRAAIAVQKYHFGTKSLSFYVGGNKLKGRGTYTPNDLFDTDEHKVQYANLGQDVNSAGITIMQLTGSELMSKTTARRKHPLIEDAEFEEDMIQVEGLKAAVLADIQTRATSPDPAAKIPTGDLIKLLKLVETDKKDLAEAWDQVQMEAQERQAQQAPQGDPATQPGMEMPGSGAEMAPIPEPGPGIDNLASMFNRLRQPRAPQQEVMAG